MMAVKSLILAIKCIYNDIQFNRYSQKAVRIATMSNVYAYRAYRSVDKIKSFGVDVKHKKYTRITITYSNVP